MLIWRGAGTLPSQTIYENLNLLLNCENVRQDHIYSNRKVNEKNEVMRLTFQVQKLVGILTNAYVIFPDQWEQLVRVLVIL
ncbi:MAG: hypothetical protein U0T83_05255 [Bacteriovoracaceae bacterium]